MNASWRRHGSEYHCHFPFNLPLIACEIATKGTLEGTQNNWNIPYIFPHIPPMENVESSLVCEWCVVPVRSTHSGLMCDGKGGAGNSMPTLEWNRLLSDHDESSTRESHGTYWGHPCLVWITYSAGQYMSYEVYSQWQVSRSGHTRPNTCKVNLSTSGNGAGADPLLSLSLRLCVILHGCGIGCLYDRCQLQWYCILDPSMLDVLSRSTIWQHGWCPPKGDVPTLLDSYLWNPDMITTFILVPHQVQLPDCPTLPMSP